MQWHKKCNVKRNVWSLPSNYNRRRKWRWNCCAGSVVTSSGDDEDDQCWVFFLLVFLCFFWNDEASVFSSSPPFPSLFFLFFSHVFPSQWFLAWLLEWKRWWANGDVGDRLGSGVVAVALPLLSCFCVAYYLGFCHLASLLLLFFPLLLYSFFFLMLSPWDRKSVV